MAEIEIPNGDINNILVDGNSAGDIFNAALHNPDAVGDIKAAVASLIAGNSTELKQQVETLTNQLASVTTDRDAQAAEVANLQQAMTGYWQKTVDGKKLNLQLGIAQLNGSVAALQKMAESMQADLAALG